MTDKEQKELLRASIIGCGEADVMTLPQQMVAGVNQFSHLYDDVEIDINDDRNAASSSSVVGGTTPNTRGNMVLPPKAKLFKIDKIS